MTWYSILDTFFIPVTDCFLTSSEGIAVLRNWEAVCICSSCYRKEQLSEWQP